MSMRVIFPHHWQTQPWKNGGGITHEIIKENDESWRYRLSIAEVAHDGPFSTFDGIDRIIMLLSGKGFELCFGGGHMQALVQAEQPFPFRGEDPVQCDLIDGPVRDFNVMTRREAVTTHAEVYSLTAQRLTVNVGSLVHFVFVLDGQVFAEVNEHGYVLEAQQLLMIDQEKHPLQLSALKPNARVYSIAIHPRA